MRHIKRLRLLITLVVLTMIMAGCEFANKDNEIKESFEKTLKTYPIKNLEEFFDKEGYRDGEFDKNDKGTWVLNSSLAKRETHDGDLIVKGMVLRMNRNTKLAVGEYYINTISENKKGEIKKEGKKYSIKLENNKIIPSESLKNDKIRKEIDDFRFFVQYANFKDLDNYGLGNFDYNPNVPSYSAEYQLSNDDDNVEQLRKRYDIPTDKAPKLLLKGVGEFKGSSVGYQQLQIEFEENKEKSIYFTDFVSLNPSEDGE